MLGCARRVEGAPGRPVFDRRRDFVAGDVVFAGLRDEARRARERPHRVAARYRRGYGAVKVLAGVRAGISATVAIAPSGRDSAGLAYGTSPDPRRPRDNLDDSESVVEFQACPQDEPRFHGQGRVGLHTHFAGGFILARAHCLRLRVSIRGRAARRYELAYGVPARRC